MTYFTPFDLLLLGLVFVALPTWSIVAPRYYARISRTGRSRSTWYSLIAIRGAALATLVLIAWAKASRPLAGLGLDWPVGIPGRIGFAVDALIAGYYVMTLQFKEWSQTRVETTRARLRRLRTYDMLPSTPREFATYPIAAIVASTSEELLYRGYLVGLFASAIGPFAAVLGSSVLFGVGHLYQGAMGVVRTCAIGLLFAIGLVITHSLWWLVIAHAVANLSGVLLARRLLTPEPVSAK